MLYDESVHPFYINWRARQHHLTVTILTQSCLILPQRLINSTGKSNTHDTFSHWVFNGHLASTIHGTSGYTINCTPLIKYPWCSAYSHLAHFITRLHLFKSKIQSRNQIANNFNHLAKCQSNQLGLSQLWSKGMSWNLEWPSKGRMGMVTLNADSEWIPKEDMVSVWHFLIWDKHSHCIHQKSLMTLKALAIKLAALLWKSLVNFHHLEINLNCGSLTSAYCLSPLLLLFGDTFFNAQYSISYTTTKSMHVYGGKSFAVCVFLCALPLACTFLLSCITTRKLILSFCLTGWISHRLCLSDATDGMACLFDSYCGSVISCVKFTTLSWNNVSHDQCEESIHSMSQHSRDFSGTEDSLYTMCHIGHMGQCQAKPSINHCSSTKAPHALMNLWRSPLLFFSPDTIISMK